MHHPLNPRHIEALEARGLDAEIVSRMGVYSCKRVDKDEQDKTPVPSISGDMVAYPYHDERGEVVNTKYIARRGSNKIYSQTPGGKKIFYNLQAALDVDLQEPEGSARLCILEGENDVLASLSAGHPWTIGIPDGGSPAFTETGKPIPMTPDEELDPATEKKFEFINNCWELLLPVRRVVLWMDWDDVGDRLRDELARRLDKVRCFAVHRPLHMRENVVKAVIKDKTTKTFHEIMRPVKDANEVLVHYGKEAVLFLIATARPMPMVGLYTIDDFEERRFVTYSTGFSALDPYLKLYDTAFTVATGLPQSGKSLLWNQIAFNMAELYGWRIGFASFEMPVKPELERQLRSFRIKRPRSLWTQADVDEADRFIREHFVFINRDPLGISDIAPTPEWLCEQTQAAVIRYGINMQITDPWNELSHKRNRNEMRDEYTMRVISMIKDVSQQLKVAHTIIGHPTAEAGRSAKDGHVISMFDMADGAAWNNKAEYGMVVHRRGMRKSDVICEPYIRKVKFQESTETYPGNCGIVYVPEEGRFDPSIVPSSIDEDVEQSDARAFQGRKGGH